MLKRRTFCSTAAATPFVTGLMMTESEPAVAVPASNTVLMELKYGNVTILLRPDLAPLAAERIRVLTAQGFYDGCKFFRVIPGFVAQTGDPTNTGMHGSDLPNLPAEFTNDTSFLTGAVGMARTSDPNSANSQFFICLAPATFLDGNYTLVGQVTAGMDAVEKIKSGVGQNGTVTDPDSIIKMTLVA
jgi:peptidylprolyl isomerase